MAVQHIPMPGNEFVQKLLDGERDFASIVLEPYYSLAKHEGFSELQEALQHADMENHPVVLEGADLTGLDADGLTMPFLKANGACFKHATMMEANVESSEFEAVDFRYAKLPQAGMKSCHFRDADLRQADLNLAVLNGSLFSGADVAGANLLFTNLQACDIQGIRNLGMARAVETANFQFVSLSDRERSIIRAELWTQQGKKRRLFGGAG